MKIVGRAPMRPSIEYLFLAWLVVAFHIAFAAFAAVGGFLVAFFPALLWPQLAAMVWSVGTLAFDWGCPATPLEKSLRERAGTANYEEGFVQHYLTRTAYSGVNARRLHQLLALAVLLINLFAYRGRLGLA